MTTRGPEKLLPDHLPKVVVVLTLVVSREFPLGLPE
jgi:hypothetical protein